MSSQPERVEFPGTGGQTLSGRVHRPAGGARAWALFAHCFTCSKDLRAAVRIAESLCDHGIGVLRFDFTGLGHSEGDFADTNFTSNIGDLVAAAGYLADRHRAPQVLVGHSLGGAAVIAAARQLPSVRAVATIGAPADPAHVTHLFSHASDQLTSDGEAEVVLAGRRFRLKQQLVDDLTAQPPIDVIAAMDVAFLFCHAPRDQYVGIDNARLLFQAARHPKSFVSLDDADHLLTRDADSRYVGAIVGAWASRYVEAPAEVIADEAEPGTVIVRDADDGFAQEIRAGRHRLRADEPVSVGGDDSGPTPYDLLLAGLGACTSMTMRMYANRKDWALDNVTVTLTHAKIHARDCEDCESEGGKVDEIHKIVQIEGDLDDAQRKRLLEIADMCPVHRTLHGEVKVRTRLA